MAAEVETKTRIGARARPTDRSRRASIKMDASTIAFRSSAPVPPTLLVSDLAIFVLNLRQWPSNAGRKLRAGLARALRSLQRA